MTWRKLTVEELKYSCDLSSINNKSTEDMPPLEEMIGQERAVQATEFGLRIKRPGYNIFMTGLTGTGKSSYAQNIIEKLSTEEAVPDDWLYVYNFDSPSEPIALSLPAGMGHLFYQHMQELLADLREIIPKVFSGDDYERQKNVFVKDFQDARSSLLEELNGVAQDKGFELKRTSSGFVTVPLHNGEQISEEDFSKLDQEKKDKLEKKSNEVQLKVMEVMRRIQIFEKEFKKKLRDLDYKFGLSTIGHLFNDLVEQYKEHPKVITYLNAYRQDVLANLDDFKGEDDDHQNALFWLQRHSQEKADIRYMVNILVDNRELKGAPMVYETNPSYYNLLGRVEYENRFGMVVTDFSMIKPGALHRSNGGYLILQARDVLTAMQSWEVLKRVLRTREVRIENIGEHFGLVAMSTLKPEPIPLNIKVVMIGNPYIYHLLYHYDEDFRKLFKIKADFDIEMTRDSENIKKMVAFIAYHCQKHQLRHFDLSAIAEIVEYSSRLAENRDKLCTCFNDIVDLLFEADAWADLDDANKVSQTHVIKALEDMVYRSNKYEQKVMEAIKEEKLLLDLEGTKVGQLNGLSVIDQGDYSFGRPAKITASTFLGRKGIINIERESDLSGKIHKKGVLILSGYLGMRYGQQTPINITASLCFEQSYTGVDGDSASAAELFAILSSLAEVPLRQDIAVTGSINQKGEIQPVGGINHKIEGFFMACKAKGLNGKQGVIIPEQNIKSLILKKEVVEAVRKEMFNVYTIKNVDDGMYLLTGMESGELNENGSYPENTINKKVIDKLKEYNKKNDNENGQDENV